MVLCLFINLRAHPDRRRCSVWFCVYLLILELTLTGGGVVFGFVFIY